jgi:hypothetical protein
MMPMVFWASLPPWPSEMRDAAANWSDWKTGSTVRGLARTKTHETPSIKARARKKPKSGESTMNAPVVSRPVQTIALNPAFVSPAYQAANKGMRTA